MMHVALYIHSIYIVLGILSHQETICNIQGDASRFICKHHAILCRDFSAHLFWYLGNSGANLFFFFNVSVHICAHAVEFLGCGGGASGHYLDMVSR